MTVERLKLPVSTATTADNYIFTHLKNGGSRDMNVDGTTPAHFDYVATADCKIQRINFVCLDANMTPVKFFGLTALTNGCLMKVLDTDGSTVIHDFMDGQTIKTHTEFGLLAGPDVPVLDGTGTDAVIIRWTLAKAGAALLLLEDQRIRFTVQDNITGLTNFWAMVQGTLA